MPVHEETFLFSKNKEKFNDLLLPIPEYDPLLKVHNKDILYDILQSLSILTPKTYPLSEFENFDDIRSKISGRIILKPRQGGGNWGLLLPNIKNSYSSQINNYLKSSNINPSRILVQEWIPVNEKFSHVVIYQHGKLVQDFGTCAVVL